MPELFDMEMREIRRDRAAAVGPELFLAERTFEDCLERIQLQERSFDNALLIGCPDPAWPGRLLTAANAVEVRDPSARLARAAGGKRIVEDSWEAPRKTYDLVVAIGTLDTVNDLPLALQLIRHSLRDDGLFIGAMPGGDTLPLLRGAMLKADATVGGAAPHVHPRIEPSALAPLLEHAGFTRPVVDVDRVSLGYSSFDRLIADLRAMGATNILHSRPPRLTRKQLKTAAEAFVRKGEKATEIVEILHFAAWTPRQG